MVTWPQIFFKTLQFDILFVIFGTILYPILLQFPCSTESIFCSPPRTPADQLWTTSSSWLGWRAKFGMKPYVPRSKLVWFLYRIVASRMVGIYILYIYILYINILRVGWPYQNLIDPYIDLLVPAGLCSGHQRSLRSHTGAEPSRVGVWKNHMTWGKNALKRSYRAWTKLSFCNCSYRVTFMHVFRHVFFRLHSSSWHRISLMQCSLDIQPTCSLWA